MSSKQPKSQNCQTCKYFEYQLNYAKLNLGFGFCRRNPPARDDSRFQLNSSIVDNRASTLWPIVSRSEDWCGEWKS